MSIDGRWIWVAVAAGGVALLGWGYVRLRRHRGFGDSPDDPEALRKIVGRSAVVQRMKEQIRRFAPSHTPVLVVGESGTGKELVAEALHMLSPRAGKKYIVANIAAIPDTLRESELFGHTKGSYTGAATARPGMFRKADGGTLFLDEIGEASLPLQAALLRALDQGEIRPVGADEPTKVDVRVIAATNRDLEQAVHHGMFRQDLYQRLKSLQIPVPALRHRKEDIASLAKRFAREIATREGKGAKVFWTDDATERLQSYDYSAGNIRELRNIIEAAIMSVPASGGNLVDYLNLPTLPAAATSKTLAARVAEFERSVIKEELDIAGSDIEAARRLGLNVATLWRKRKKYGLDGLCLSGECDI